MMVLWVLVILMVVVLSFTFMSRTELRSTLAFREGLQKASIAESGIERGIMEIFYRRQNLNKEPNDTWKTDMTTYTGELGDGRYEVAVMDESGKVDINAAPDIILRNLLNNIGIQGEEADTIVDSVMDWKDADDLHRLYGVESSYYQSLPVPYKAKNADFETLEELLLVKGVTPEILFGNGERKALVDFITIHSRNAAINLNAASREVLMSIPGISSEVADQIIALRETKDIRTMQDVHALLGQNYSAAAPYLRVGEGTVFTIDSTGFDRSKKGGYRIVATVVVRDNNRYRFVYYKKPVGIKN